MFTVDTLTWLRSLHKTTANDYTAVTLRLPPSARAVRGLKLSTCLVSRRLSHNAGDMHDLLDRQRALRMLRDLDLSCGMVEKGNRRVGSQGAVGDAVGTLSVLTRLSLDRNRVGVVLRRIHSLCNTAGICTSCIHA